MRQAGRSLPEYRSIRGSESILHVLKDPELSAKITLQPVERYGVDAAILYSDIVAPYVSMPLELDIVPGLGPVAGAPLRGPGDLDRLRPLDPDRDLSAMAKTVDICTSALEVPLIGFAGGPFTVASYLVEGRPSRDYLLTKELMFNDEQSWHHIMDALVDVALTVVGVQVAHGASVVQVFDSWIGALSPRHFNRFVKGHLERLAAGISTLGVPSIYFGVGTVGLLPEIIDIGFAAIGLDWRSNLRSAALKYGGSMALQGNLDPAVLFATEPLLLAEVAATLEESAPAAGYVFNLGHGVLPATDPGKLAAVVSFVHESGLALRTEEFE